MKIKIIAAVLTVLALAALIPVMAGVEDSDAPAIVIDSKEVSAEVGETVSVNVGIVNNPGVVTLTLPVIWDTEVLELTGITNTYTILAETEECNGWLGTDDYEYAQSNGVYYLAWDNDLAVENFSGDGILCTMVFEIKKEFTETAVNVVMESGETILPISNIMNFDMDDLQDDFTYVEGVLTAGGSEADTVTVQGTVTSFKDNDADITIEMFREGNTTGTPDYSTTVKGNSASYSISGVTPGNYIIRISKPNHVTREYSVTVYAQ
ncbi:MAG: hypothetical protein IJF78_02410 [Clostridia bacterium]|nr:hypothetical protein [Clostridia bacterium]